MKLWLSALLLLALAGCTAHDAAINRQLDVFGVALHAATDYREIQGVQASEEPCLRGYDRSFDALDLTVGYGFNGKIRKITTRNPRTSLFGVRPGTPLAAGSERVLQAGFRELRPPLVYQRDGYTLTFLVAEGSIFGITLETAD